MCEGLDAIGFCPNMSDRPALSATLNIVRPEQCPSRCGVVVIHTDGLPNLHDMAAPRKPFSCPNSGEDIPVENLAESLQVAFDAGAKRILLPMASVKDIPTIPGELFAKFQTGFYADPVDAVFKALGVQ